jgi:hypothetical protein
MSSLYSTTIRREGEIMSRLPIKLAVALGALGVLALFAGALH